MKKLVPTDYVKYLGIYIYIYSFNLDILYEIIIIY